MFLKVVYRFMFPLAVCESSGCSIFLAMLGTVGSGRYVVIRPYNFNLWFLKITDDLEHLFMCFFSIIYFLVEVSVQIFCPFKKIGCFLLIKFWEYKGLEIQVLLKIPSLHPLFFQSVACPFILLAVSFEGQKFLILLKSSLPIVFFYEFQVFFFHVLSGKYLLNQMLQRFSLISSRCLLVLAFTFCNSLCRFLYIMWDKGYCLCFSDIDNQLFQHHFLDGLS